MSCEICCWRASISGEGDRCDGPGWPVVCDFFGAIFVFVCVVRFVGLSGLVKGLLCVICISMGLYGPVKLCVFRWLSSPRRFLALWLSSPRCFLAGLFVGV